MACRARSSTFWKASAISSPIRKASSSECRKSRSSCGQTELMTEGLGYLHRQYLNYLGVEGSASLQTLALYIQTDCDFVQRQIEPLLLRQGLSKIENSGRELTDKGREVYEQMKEESRKEDNNHGNC